MSAMTQWKVKILRVVEDTIEVSAVTRHEAEEEAAKQKGVAQVLSVTWKEYTDNEEEYGN